MGTTSRTTSHRRGYQSYGASIIKMFNGTRMNKTIVVGTGNEKKNKP